MPVSVGLQPVTPKPLGLYELTPDDPYGGLIPAFVPGVPAIPGVLTVGGISTITLRPADHLPGTYPGVFPGPAVYPGSGVTVPLTVRSVVAGNLVPAVPTTATLTQAATVALALPAEPIGAGLFPGAGVYPGPARYPVRQTMVRLVPEPVAA